MERENIGETICISCRKKIGFNVMMTSNDGGETWYHNYDCLKGKEGGE